MTILCLVLFFVLVLILLGGSSFSHPETNHFSASNWKEDRCNGNLWFCTVAEYACAVQAATSQYLLIKLDASKDVGTTISIVPAINIVLYD